jgi:hypothetical protein
MLKLVFPLDIYCHELKHSSKSEVKETHAHTLTRMCIDTRM